MIGCTDSQACNYNEEADSDDGSCEYPEENYDCEGNCIAERDCNDYCGGTAELDECNICDNDSTNDCIQDECGIFGGNGYIDACGTLCEECDISSDSIYLTSDGELWYNISEPIYGFQIDFHGILVTRIDDGDAQNSDLDVHYSSNDANNSTRVVSFSMNSNNISPGCGTLFKLNFDGNITDVSNIIFSAEHGFEIDVEYYQCP